MTTSAVNKFILFRNYATTGSTLTLGSATTFTTAAASQFINYYLGNPQTGTNQDFGIVNVVSTGSGSSTRPDQNFITRAELINFRSNTGIANPNTLQYLGTFSRERNHPTWGASPTQLSRQISA